MQHTYKLFLLLLLSAPLSAQIRSHQNFDRDWLFAFGHAQDPEKDFNYGLETVFSNTEKIRSRPASKRVPVLVLTASGGPQEWKQLSALGADGFLVKPVNLKDVATLVRRALAERA